MTLLELGGMVIAIPLLFLVIGLMMQIILRLVDSFGNWLDERLGL